MLTIKPKGFDRTNAITGFAVWLLVIFIYNLTKANTLSLWDCGEFIAACFRLGIPHPPGTPLYLLAGRIATLFPFIEDIPSRVNFLSVVCSATAALFGYLILVRLFRQWFCETDSLFTRVLMYAGSVCGALLLALGRTQWNNSVEAEVYGMSMMLMFAVIWLTFIFIENRDTIKGERYMLLAIYLAFLGLGVHMTTLLVIPISLLVFVLKKEAPQKIWYLFSLFFFIEFFMIFALSSRPGEIPFNLVPTIIFFIYIFYLLSFEKLPTTNLLIGLWFTIASIPTMASVLNADGSYWRYIGQGGLVILVGHSLFIFLKWYRVGRRIDQDNKHDLIAASFGVITGLLTVLTISPLKGYATFLFLSVVLFLLVGWYSWRYIRIPILIAMVGPLFIVLGVWEFFWGVIGSALILIAVGLKWNPDSWRRGLLIILVAVMGFSVHLVVPIRSSLHPIMNENNPSKSVAATISFIERKQYGSQSMLERMFKRRAEWENQFGDSRRMGFWHFFKEQFGSGNQDFIPYLLLGLLGLWEAVRRKPEKGLYLVTLLIVASVGLILYMNFADGNRRNPVTGGDWMEVRNRDYFFTPAYMIFGLAVGMGCVGLLNYLREFLNKINISTGIAAPFMFIFLLLPGYTVAKNYYYADRSKDFFAYDYAWNILNSVDQNGVVFTAGDNDTFPVWCLQQVYGVRTDVKVVNLSLSNMGWYIRQIRDDMGLDLGWRDQQIDSLTPYRYTDGRKFRVQDQVIDAIVSHHSGSIPIFFSSSAGPGSRMVNGRNIDSLLQATGLALRLSSKIPDNPVDIDHSMELMVTSGLFKYRGFNDPDVYVNETAYRLANNTAAGLLRLSEGLRVNGRSDDAVKVLEYAYENIPIIKRLNESLAMVYAQGGKPESLARILETDKKNKKNKKDNKGNYINRDKRQALLGRAFRKAENEVAAESVYISLLNRSPHYRTGLDELMSLYIGQRNVGAMIKVLNIWIANNPGDTQITQALVELKKQQDNLKPAGDSQ